MSLEPEKVNPKQVKPEDEKWMREALKWSWRGRGWVAPRPSVGAVLVRDNRIIGGGHTQPGDGQPHAEVMALREAAQNGGAKGATAYVTLEPCSHWATTPPCSEALIEAGVARVVVGVVDPNPLIAGRGLIKLREAGIEVVQGVLATECLRAHDDFLHSIVAKTPFVTLKAGVSLDGKIALPSGQSQWITGPASRERAHLLRHYSDAVLVGIETVLADNPSLNVRLEGRHKQPARIVLDSKGRLPLDAKIWTDAPQLIVVTAGATQKAVEKLRDNGATVWEFEPDENGHPSWAPLLENLYAQKVCSLLIEGGAHVAGSALAAGIVGKVAFFIAPMLMGEGKSALAGFEVPDLGLAPRLHHAKVEALESDVLVEGYIQDYFAD